MMANYLVEDRPEPFAKTRSGGSGIFLTHPQSVCTFIWSKIC
jgi:hypothetical protein